MPKNKHTFNAIFNTFSYRQKKNKNNLPFTEDAKKLFMSEKIIEKIQVLSLLSALKLYFGEKSEK